jgi:hypothetical protein
MSRSGFYLGAHSDPHPHSSKKQNTQPAPTKADSYQGWPRRGFRCGAPKPKSKRIKPKRKPFKPHLTKAQRNRMKRALAKAEKRQFLAGIDTLNAAYDNLILLSDNSQDTADWIYCDNQYLAESNGVRVPEFDDIKAIEALEQPFQKR